MNAFRITLLVLLTMVIALMFYAIQVVVPGWQSQYDEYVASERVNNLQQRMEAHRARIDQLSTKVDSPEVASARAEDEEIAASSAKTLNEAEEQSVIAEARAAEEARQVREAKRELDRQMQEADNRPLCLVAAYDAEWGIVLLRPVSDQPINNGLVVAIRHGADIVCEATIDGKDEESGQYTATVKAVSSQPAKSQPQVGDEVIISPFPSVRDLRNESGIHPLQHSAAPLPAVPAPVPAAPADADNPDNLPSIPLDAGAPDGLPEQEAQLIPVP